MKDELVRRISHAVLLCIATSFAGCNGCSGCEGQTPELASSTGANSTEPAATVAPSVAPTPVETTAPIASDAVIHPAPEHDPTGVVRCCKSIKDNLEAAPEKHRATWKSALDKCNEAVEKKTGRTGLEPVREILTPVGYPVACH